MIFNNFISYKNWLNENINDDVIVLFPGSFKPMHAAHVKLIDRYAQHPDVKEVRVLVGPGIRNGISQKEALEIANLLLDSYDNVKVEASSYPSPILTAYKFIETAPPGTYAMASSEKDEGARGYQRVVDFVNHHQPGGKYHSKMPDGVNVIELQVNIKPVLYVGRTDEYDNTPISASILRQDILNDNYINFRTNYPSYDEKTIKTIWDMSQMVITESYKLFEGGNIFEGTGPIKKEHIEPTVQKFKQRISSIFPNVDFTFKLLGSAGKKDISGDIDLALSENVLFDENDNLKFDDWNVDPDTFKNLYEQARKRARTATEKQTKFNVFVKLIAEQLINDDLISSDVKKSGAGTLFCSFPQYDNASKELPQRVQIDINIGNINWLEFSYYSEVYQGNVKGLHRTQLMVALFANKHKTFRHGTGVYDLDAGEYLAKTPDEAVDLLNELYNFKTKKLNRDIISNFFKLHDFLKQNLSKEELHNIYDIYLKILDSTRCDVPDDLQEYWIENKERLNLKGAFLPEDSNLYKYVQ